MKRTVLAAVVSVGTLGLGLLAPTSTALAATGANAPAAAAPGSAATAADRGAPSEASAAQTARAAALAARSVGQAKRRPSYTPPPIAWGACTNARLKAAGAQCGMLTVPLDYAKPSGTKIQIAVSRIKHSTPDSQYQGVMLVNPGGPGGSGLTLSRLGSWVPDQAGASYDWIGFDPRGVGSSVPSLSCDGNYFGYNRPNYIPSTAALEKTWLAKAKAYAQKCDAAGGELLDHVKTVDTVADMDSIRKALGEKQINFYGFSYGSYLGQVYATQHPAQVRRMVLDGVVDARGVWYKANLSQDVAFNKSITIFFDWVAKHDAVYHLGTTGAAVRHTWYDTRAALAKSPALGKIGPDEWTDAFLGAGYYVYGWEQTAEAFSAAINGNDWSQVLDLYDSANGSGPGSDNGYAMYLATQCTDVKWPSWKKQRIDNWRINSKAPFETWANNWFNAPCLFWGAKASKPVKVKGKNAPPILLIGETYDAATPFTGALYTRKIFPRSVLIEGVGGTTHSGSLSGVACTDNAIAAYLKNGALPTRQRGNGSDLKCSPVPAADPQPTTTAPGQKSASGSLRVGTSRKARNAELQAILTEAQRVR